MKAVYDTHNFVGHYEIGYLDRSRELEDDLVIRPLHVAEPVGNDVYCAHMVCLTTTRRAPFLIPVLGNCIGNGVFLDSRP